MAGQAGEVGKPPAHYQTEAGFGPFDVIDAFGMDFYIGSAFRYLARYGKKGSSEDALEDLRKARHYIEEKINRIEAGRDG